MYEIQYETQPKAAELKSPKTEMKNSLEVLNSRFDLLNLIYGRCLLKIFTGECFSCCFLRQKIIVEANDRLVNKLGRKVWGIIYLKGL